METLLTLTRVEKTCFTFVRKSVPRLQPSHSFTAFDYPKIYLAITFGKVGLAVHNFPFSLTRLTMLNFPPTFYSQVAH